MREELLCKCLRLILGKCRRRFEELVGGGRTRELPNNNPPALGNPDPAWPGPSEATTVTMATTATTATTVTMATTATTAAGGGGQHPNYYILTQTTV